MKKRIASVLAVFALALCFVAPATAQQPDPPNIIFIMLDDHPWHAFGFMGEIENSGTFPVPTQHPDLPPIDTPNLDRLADRGTTFPVGSSGATVCIPSFRSALIAKYLKDDTRDGNALFMGDFLNNAAGYISYGFGKLWGDYPVSGFTHGGIRTKKLPRTTLDPLWNFVDDQAAQHPAGDGPPWFIWYSPRLPHGPFRESQQFWDLFPKSLFKERRALGQRLYANVLLLDFWIGELMDGLTARGIDQNTMIFTMNDNGYLMPRSKRGIIENGFRTPIMLSWPGQIPAGQIGQQMVHAVDFIPTALDYMGAPIPEELEGQSLRQWIDNPGDPGREYLLNHKLRPPRRFLRTRDGLRFRTKKDGHKKIDLFDLTVNPNEDKRFGGQLANDAFYATRIEDFKMILDSWWLPDFD